MIKLITLRISEEKPKPDLAGPDPLETKEFGDVWHPDYWVLAVELDDS